jgi:hypothetical protein
MEAQVQRAWPQGQGLKRQREVAWFSQPGQELSSQPRQELSSQPGQEWFSLPGREWFSLVWWSFRELS